jgi:hypothetical protein
MFPAISFLVKITFVIGKRGSHSSAQKHNSRTAQWKYDHTSTGFNASLLRLSVGLLVDAKAVWLMQQNVYRKVLSLVYIRI